MCVSFSLFGSPHHVQLFFSHLFIPPSSISISPPVFISSFPQWDGSCRKTLTDQWKVMSLLSRWSAVEAVSCALVYCRSVQCRAMFSWISSTVSGFFQWPAVAAFNPCVLRNLLVSFSFILQNYQYCEMKCRMGWGVHSLLLTDRSMVVLQVCIWGSRWDVVLRSALLQWAACPGMKALLFGKIPHIIRDHYLFHPNKLCEPWKASLQSVGLAPV